MPSLSVSIWLKTKRIPSNNLNSPDLDPCDFFLFGRLKKPLRGTRYSTRDEVMEKSKMALMAIPQTDYEKCFEDWIKRWHKCVAVDGEYFEGDNIDYDE